MRTKSISLEESLFFISLKKLRGKRRLFLKYCIVCLLEGFIV